MYKDVELFAVPNRNASFTCLAKYDKLQCVQAKSWKMSYALGRQYEKLQITGRYFNTPILKLIIPT